MIDTVWPDCCPLGGDNAVPEGAVVAVVSIRMRSVAWLTGSVVAAGLLGVMPAAGETLDEAVAEAAASASAPRLVEGEGDEYTLVYENVDGTQTLEMHSEPQRVIQQGQSAILDRVQIYTVRTRTGEVFPPCNNCAAWVSGQ